MERVLQACSLLFLAISKVAFASTPIQPAELRIAIYSDTAAELFWQRPANDARIRTHEVRLNGSIVATTDGYSFFADNLRRAERYVFNVVAIDVDDNRSEPAFITFYGGGPELLPPANVRVQVYSSTAIELFWDRVNGVPLSYEIVLGESTAGSTDGTSFFIDGLSAGRSYAISVEAIDPDGNRSEPTQLTLTTPSNRPPMAPSNVSQRVYSDTAIELFWALNSTDNIVSTEVTRNGEILGLVDGTSFFDDTRESGLFYHYRLTAIDSAGRRSSTSSFMDEPDLPIINHSNYQEIVAEVLSTYHGARYDLLNTFRRWILGSFIPDTFSGVFPPAIRNCANGGSADISSIVDLEFIQCQADEYFINGRTSYWFGNVTDFSTGGDGLYIETNSDVSLSFTGLIATSGLVEYGYRAVAESLVLRTPADILTLESLDTEFSLGVSFSSPNTFTSDFSGDFNIQSASTGGEFLRVSTIDSFSYSEPFQTHSDAWNYRKGILTIRARDTSQLLLSADTGDESTVSISLSDANGSDVIIRPWTTWYDALRRVP